MTKAVKLGNITFGAGKPFVLIAGPCVIESRRHAVKMARSLAGVAKKLKVSFVFKASYDKANRTSVKSPRGPGLDEGLEILKEIREKVGVPVVSDVHAVIEINKAARALDILQIPAFLCRQTDLLVAAAKTKKVINVKKGQFLAPWDMANVIDKIELAGNRRILLTERGTSFGYNTLVTDFRALDIMRGLKYPVVFDATHSVQQPGGRGTSSGGERKYVPLLARCAVAAGCDAVFLEVHDNPDKALSDGPNMLPLNQLAELLRDLKAIDAVAKRNGK